MTTETDRIEAEIDRSRHALNDTIEQLGGKLSPGQILDEALGVAQGQAGQFTANLGRQVRDNPIPLLLLGAGIAMLFMKKQDSSQTPRMQWSEEDSWQEQRFNALERARAKIVRRDDEAQADYEQRLHEAEARALGLEMDSDEETGAFRARVKKTGEKLGHTVTGIRGRMGSAMHSMGSGMDRAGHAMGAGVGQAAHAVGSGVGAVKSGMGHAAHAMGSGMSSAKEFVGNRTQNLKDSLETARYRTQDLYNEYPLAAGAIGLAVGALIGATAPLTDMEREQLKGVADKAAKTGADLAEKGARAVERTTEKATAAIH